MAAQIPENSPSSPRSTVGQQWAQTSFLAADAGAAQDESLPRAVAEALVAADHAADQRSRRDALDRLSTRLTQQALRRGLTPVPKRGI